MSSKGEHAREPIPNKKPFNKNIIVVIIVVILSIIAAVLGFMLGSNLNLSELARVFD